VTTHPSLASFSITVASSGLPEISTILRREVAPRLMVIADLGTPSVSLRNSINAAFALLSTAGAAILTFSAAPCNPTISLFLAPG